MPEEIPITAFEDFRDDFPTVTTVEDDISAILRPGAKPEEEPEEVAVEAEWEELRMSLTPVLEGLQNGLVSAAASTMATAANAGFEDVGVKGAQLLLGLNLKEFAKKVVVQMARGQNASAAGKLNLAAVNMGAASLVTQLSSELLCKGHVEEAAEVTAAFWDAAAESGMEPYVAAASCAPAIIKAIDAGHALDACNVQRILVKRGYMSLVVWLSVAVAEHCNRPDAVALGSWTALQKQGAEGLQLAADVAAMTMVEGFYDIAATVGGELYDLATKKGGGEKAIEVLVLAAHQAVAVNKAEAVVAVTELLMKDPKRQELAISSLIYMVEHNVEGSGVEDAAKVSISAVRGKKMALSVQLVRGISARGKTQVLTAVGGEMMKQTAGGIYSVFLAQKEVLANAEVAEERARF